MAGKEYSRIPIEFYVGPRVLSGYLSISAGQRLLDLLNQLGDLDRDVQSDYIEFAPDAASDGEVRYVRKSSVEIAALSDPNLARGAGGRGSSEVYLRLEKSAVPVSLEMPGYVIDGNIHCSPGRKIRDVLDENTLFLPLTDVTMVCDSHVYGTRPFVAVRKDLIISVAQEEPVLVSPPQGREVWKAGRGRQEVVRLCEDVDNGD